MLVQDYLRSNSVEALAQAYGISATRHKKYNNIVLFKYDQIESPHADSIVIECRGLILDEADNWKVICRPYDRFFNYEEGCAAKIDWSTARVYDKLDGSLMKLYWYDNAWQVSSSGSPDASGPVNNNSAKTFADLFWETFSALGYKLPQTSLSEFTFMFELMTPENRVLVPHEKARLVLHGIRSNREPYIEIDPADITERTNTEGNRLCFSDPGWEVVKAYPLSSIDDVVATAKALNPMQNEGFVVVDANFRRVKVKSPQYVALSHMKDSFSERRMIELVRTNEGSEFLSYFPEYTGLYNDVKSAYDKLLTGTVEAYEKIKDIEAQKDFAIEAVKSKCSGAMFAVRSKKAPSIQEYIKEMSITSLEKLLDLRRSSNGMAPDS